MIWDRERYIAHCNFEFTGREMFCELFGLLIGLEEEWQRQGASAKEIALTAFDWDYVLKAPLAGRIVFDESLRRRGIGYWRKRRNLPSLWTRWAVKRSCAGKALRSHCRWNIPSKQWTTG